MNTLESLFLDSIFILFPLFSYIIFVINEQNLGKKASEILFDLALFTSMYLIIKFDTNNDAVRVMFLTLPLLLAYLRKKEITVLIFNIVIGIYYFNYFQINIFLIIFELSLYLIFLYILRKKIKNDSSLITIFAIVKIIFVFFELGFPYAVNLNQLKSFLILPIAFYFVPHIIFLLMNKSEKIMMLHRSIKELEEEKQLRDTLFKITHEIKNPLAVCKGYLEMLDVGNGDQVKRYIPVIRQEIERTLTLMSDFMNLTKLNVEKRKMDLSVLLQDVSEIASLMLKNTCIEYKTSLIDSEIYVDGDYDRLKQVFINIIKNAKEAILTNEEGVIRFESKVHGGYIIISVVDNGIGMSKEIMSRIGEAFYTTKSNGTGLGVKLSKEIVDAHNGIIEYKSKPDIGTTVLVKLPMKKSL